MLLPKDAILFYASHGNMTLEINTHRVTPIESEEVPDNWICQLEPGTKLPAPKGSKKSYPYYLTRMGWEANKYKLKEAFVKAPCHKTPDEALDKWEKYKGTIEAQLKQVERNVYSAIDMYLENIENLTSYLIYSLQVDPTDDALKSIDPEGKNMSKEQPRFKHVCPNCTFLGHFQGHDLYHCTETLDHSVLARYGDNDHDFHSASRLYIETHLDKFTMLAEAFRRIEKD